MVVFDKCTQGKDPGIVCKSDAEIKSWMFNKYILIYINSKKFVQHKFEGDSIAKKAKTIWLRLNPDIRLDQVIEIEREEYEI